MKRENQVFNNINQAERNAPLDLKQNTRIGVIQSVQKYEKEIERQLKDSHFYQQLSKNPTTEF